MRLAITVLAITMLAPAVASAERWAVYGETTYRTSSYRGDLGREFGTSWLGWQLGLGLRVEQLAVAAAADFHTVESLDAERHGDDLWQFGAGPEAKYFFGPEVGWRGYVRAGYRWSWIKGDFEVRRLCGETGQCDAGFWFEKPSYAGRAVRLGVGVEFLPPGAARQNMLAAFFVDAGYDLATHDVVGEETSGSMISLSIGAAIGGGRLR